MSELPSTTLSVIVEVMVPSMMVSFAPVTVTVCAEFQFPEVKVRVAGDTVASPVSPDVTEITTFEAG